ncbi:HlyD family secretion protein [Cerasicoccus maritimus]|uniref:HlyD family secretion protein n=1 Tax=Cerasicoccus maritimus TaxID=490089 RepID=UPI002852D74A|nr:HlyD family secretion protein [Cerasicoccus maritimus]
MKAGKLIASGVVVAVAVVAGVIFYLNFLRNPWTRDARVTADIVQIASRVSGPVVKLAVKDNQFVRRGDLLFRIDPRTFAANRAQAEANLAIALDNYETRVQQVEVAKAQVLVAERNITKAQNGYEQAVAKIAKDKAELERQKAMLEQRATSQKSVERAQASYDITILGQASAADAIEQAKAGLVQAEANLASARAQLGEVGENNAMLRQARAALELATFNMEFTEIRAPVTGHVTNLSLRLGNDVSAGRPVMAIIDEGTFRINAYFQETQIDSVIPGNEATVTLMSYPERPLKAYVESVGWGIFQSDGSAGSDMLPQVNPSFEWIRLAQRVPVHVRLIDPPADLPLRVGTTASVKVDSGKFMPEGSVSIVPLQPAQ